MKKLIWILPLLALVAVGVWLRGRKTEKQPEAAAQGETVKVSRGDLLVKVEATGQVVSNRDVDIKSKASGEIVHLPFEAGDRVRHGQLLIELDPANEERRVQQAQNALSVSLARAEKARKDLEVAKAELRVERDKAAQAVSSAQVALSDAQAKAQRVDQLYHQEFASIEQWETARTTVSQSAITLQNTRLRIRELATQEQALALKRLEIKTAEAQVQADRLSLDDTLERLAETRLFAPMSGVITVLPVQEGQIVASGISNVGGGTTVMTLSDISRIFINAQVDESQVARVRPGMSVLITADAYADREFRGKVSRVAPKGVVVQNVVTFEVKIEVLDKNKHLLKPQMTTNVGIIVDKVFGARVLPVTAIRRFGAETWVMRPPKPGETPDGNLPWNPQPTGPPGSPGAQGGAGRSPSLFPGPMGGGPRGGRSGQGGGRNGGAGSGNGQGSTEPVGFPIRVKTGLTDGNMIEILEGLEEGDEVLLMQSAGSSSWQQQPQGGNGAARYQGAGGR